MFGDCRWLGLVFLFLFLWFFENSFFDVFFFIGDDSFFCFFLSFCVDFCGGEVVLSLILGLEGSIGIFFGSDFWGVLFVLLGGFEGIGGVGFFCLVKFFVKFLFLVGCLSSLFFGLKCVVLFFVCFFKLSGG